MNQLTNILFSNNIKNFCLFAGCLYGAIKIPNLITARFSNKYPFISQWIVPLGYICGLKLSGDYLGLVDLAPISSLGSWLLGNYASAMSFSHSFSMITFMIGYPTINILGRMGIYRISSIIQLINSHIGNIDPDRILATFEGFNNAVQNNDNYDVQYMGLSLRTMSQNTKIDPETLERICPLKCESMGRTDSPFVGDCGICLEEMDLKQLHRELPCRHVYHPQCVDEWLEKCNAVCPTCKKSIIQNVEQQ